MPLAEVAPPPVVSAPPAAAPGALARRYPALEAIPRVALTELPTPVVPLTLSGVAPGALFVKRDDRTSAVYGGNKPRKLEYVLAAARARGARRLVTTGGIGTHHGLATALFGRLLDMRTTIVVVPQPPTPHVREQLRALQAAGAELRPARGVLAAAGQVIRVFARATARGERPFWVSTGGSSPIGTIGFVSAAFELADQIVARELPEPAEIHLPVGSGGTFAGLVLGARLAGLRGRIVGVLVTDILPPGPRRLARLANATLALLRRCDPSLPDVRVTAGDFAIERAQLGAGYGAPTASGDEAAALARDAGLALEPTYTAKCLAAALARLRAGAAGPILFWNTYGPTPPAAPGGSEAALPRAIQRWIGA
jgi:D-cysteine desulfhydrase